MFKGDEIITGFASAKLLYCLGALCVVTGCLSLGGKTTYVQSSPDLESRVQGLETRVSALEQAVTTRQTPPLHYGPGAETMIGQAPSADEDSDGSEQSSAVRR